jgi:hypothetical protein
MGRRREEEGDQEGQRQGDSSGHVTTLPPRVAARDPADARLGKSAREKRLWTPGGLVWPVPTLSTTLIEAILAD